MIIGALDALVKETKKRKF